MPSKPYYDIGIHVAEIIDQGLTESSDKGTPTFVLKVKILGTPQPDGSYEPHSLQYERTMYLYLTEKTVDFVLPQLESLGFTGKSLGQLDPSSPGFQDFRGKQVDLWCGHKEDTKGGWKENWGLAKDQVERKPLDAKKLRNLDSLFGKGLSRAAAAPPTRSTQPVENTGITDDDIPF